MQTNLIRLKDYSEYSKELTAQDLIKKDVNKESLREWANRPSTFKPIKVKSHLKKSAGLYNFFVESVYAILP